MPSPLDFFPCYQPHFAVLFALSIVTANVELVKDLVSEDDVSKPTPEVSSYQFTT